MRVLLLDENLADVRALQHELVGRYDVRVAHTLSDAMAVLRHPTWRADAIVITLGGGDELEGLRAIENAAQGVPVLVRAGGGTEVVRRQLEGLQGLQGPEHASSYSLLKAVLQQEHHAFHQAITEHRGQIVREIERLAKQAADSAVGRTVDQLVDHLGLDDEEGLRLAIRLARGWETAKVRFFSAIVTGIGSAVLLALGAGIVAMLRSQGGR